MTKFEVSARFPRTRPFSCFGKNLSFGENYLKRSQILQTSFTDKLCSVCFQATEVRRNKKTKTSGAERSGCARQVLQRGRAQNRGSTTFVIPDVLKRLLKYFLNSKKAKILVFEEYKMIPRDFIIALSFKT